MSNIYSAVDKQSIGVALNSLQEHLYNANSITLENSLTELKQAQKELEVAEGMFNVLYELRLLPDVQTTRENLQRIRDKHEYISNEKLRTWQKEHRRKS